MADKDFKDAVAQAAAGNTEALQSVRDKLRNRLLLDRNVTSGMFNDCYEECKRAGITGRLLEPHDGRPLSGGNTEQDVNTMIGQLATNFSRERLERTLQMTKAVWPGEQGEATASAMPGRSAAPSWNTGRAQSAAPEDRTSARVASAQEASAQVTGERIISERKIGEKPLYDDGQTKGEQTVRGHSTGGQGTEADGIKKNETGAGQPNGCMMMLGAAAVIGIIIGIIIMSKK